MEYCMYEMEDILPIVAELAERYTSKESTSISYEAATKLTEAACYIICYGQEDNELVEGTISAKKAYDLGMRKLILRLQETQELYMKIMENFDSYGSRCYQDTIVKAMPEFFKRYDSLFGPKDYIIGLDYPVGVDLTDYYGVDRIYYYLCQIEKEQEYFHGQDREEIIGRLENYDKYYRDNFDNLYSILQG